MDKSFSPEVDNANGRTPRTTVGLKKATKERLDRNRATGQCYDGFLGQMVDLWEKAVGKDGSHGAGSAGGR
jgi:hypothetical protein